MGARVDAVGEEISPRRSFLDGPVLFAIAVIVIYCAGMALAWLAGSTQMPVDWALDLILTQELKAYYTVSNPPLYSWILWLMQRVLPPGQHLFLIVNYVSLATVFVLYAYAAHRVLNVRLLVVLAPTALFLIAPIGRLNFGYVHTQLMLVAYMATLTILFAIARDGRRRNFVLLGVALGMGTLAKFNYLFAVLCLVGAFCAQRELRERLLRRDLLLSVVIAVVIVTPAIYAFYAAGNDLTGLLKSKTGVGAPAGWLEQVGSGLASTGREIGRYAVHTAVLAAVVLASIAWRRGAGTVPGVDPDQAVLRRYVRDVLIAGVLVILAGILLFGMSKMEIWYLHAFFPLLPLYALILFDGRPLDRWRLGVIAGVIVVVAGIQTGTRLVAMTAACQGECRDLVPFDRLAAHLKDAGFARGTILSDGAIVAGNLRPHIPQARYGTFDGAAPPAQRPGSAPGQCLLIWRADGSEVPAPRTRSTAALLARLGLTGAQGAEAIRTARIEWRYRTLDLWRRSAERKPRATVWRYILIDRGNDRCG